MGKKNDTKGIKSQRCCGVKRAKKYSRGGKEKQARRGDGFSGGQNLTFSGRGEGSHLEKAAKWKGRRG